MRSYEVEQPGRPQEAEAEDAEKRTTGKLESIEAGEGAEEAPGYLPD